MTCILVTIGCEPGAEKCGECPRWEVRAAHHWCNLFRQTVGPVIATSSRCDACKAAEKAAEVKP